MRVVSGCEESWIPYSHALHYDVAAYQACEPAPTLAPQSSPANNEMKLFRSPARVPIFRYTECLS